MPADVGGQSGGQQDLRAAKDQPEEQQDEARRQKIEKLAAPGPQHDYSLSEKR